LSIATTVVTQIQNDPIRSVDNRRQVLRKVDRHSLRKSIEPEDRNLSLALVVEAEIALAPVTLKHGRLLFPFSCDPADTHIRPGWSFEEICDHSMVNVAFVHETEVAHALRHKLRDRNIIDTDDHVALPNISFRCG